MRGNKIEVDINSIKIYILYKYKINRKFYSYVYIH